MLQMHPSQEKSQESVHETNLLRPGSLQPIAEPSLASSRQNTALSSPCARRGQLSPSQRGGKTLILSSGCPRVSENILSPCHPHSRFPGHTCFFRVSGSSPPFPFCSASFLAHRHLLQHLCQGFAIITVPSAPTPTVFPKLLASDVHVSLFHSHAVLQIKLINVSF